MKLVRTLSLFIALAAASTVFADTPAKTPPAEKKAPAKEELSPAEVKRAEAFFDEFYNAIVKNQDACPKMATAINTVFDKHQEWLKKTADSGKDMPQASKDKIQKKMGEIMQAVMKCKDDQAVMAAFQRFATLGGKKKAESGAGAGTAPAPKTAAPPPAKK